MSRAYIDIETYSSEPIKSGVYRYSESADFRVLMMAWAVDDGPVRVAEDPQEIRYLLQEFLEDHTLVAHNAQFERICLSRHLGMPTGEYLDPDTWLDTMAIAAECGLPQSLDGWSRWVGAEAKDSAGTHLIRWFSVPDKRGLRRLPDDHPERWAEFRRYCAQDVDTMRSALKITEEKWCVNQMTWPTTSEYLTWCEDQEINDRGIRVDLEMAHAAVEAAADNREEAVSEVKRITGIENPGSVAQMTEWLDGVVPDLRADTVRSALEGNSLTSDQRRVLELRQSMALTASKKFQVALDSANSDQRIRGSARFFGAHTGRWAGRGIQLQNLPRAGFPSEAEQDAAILDLKVGLGASDQDLKALVRPLLVGPFTVVDYSAIEARVVAWLAGEKWALDAFSAGRDIYVETANRMGAGMTRAEGKIAVLALGYNGGVGSLKALGGERLGGDSALQRIVGQWRAANRNIVRLWGKMHQAFMYGGQVGDRLRVEVDGGSRHLILPSGRAIAYHDVRATRGEYGQSRLSFQDPKVWSPWKRTWLRTDTYGGRLIENATQAVARDILAAALVRLGLEGERVVAHVHDEVLVEGADEGSVERISRIMSTNPPWASGLPLSAEGYTCNRYRKG